MFCRLALYCQTNHYEAFLIYYFNKYIFSISWKYKTNRKIALKLAKQLKSVVCYFLIDKGLEFTSIIYKYGYFGNDLGS